MIFSGSLYEGPMYGKPFHLSIFVWSTIYFLPNSSYTITTTNTIQYPPRGYNDTFDFVSQPYQYGTIHTTLIVSHIS